MTSPPSLLKPSMNGNQWPLIKLKVEGNKLWKSLKGTESDEGEGGDDEDGNEGDDEDEDSD